MMLGTFRIMLLLALLVVAAVSSGAPPATDLQASLDQERQNLTLTNTLPYDLYVMSLEGEEATFPVMVRLPAGQTLQVPVQGQPVPSAITSATCIFSRPDRLPAKIPYEKGEDGFYHLSVAAP